MPATVLVRGGGRLYLVDAVSGRTELIDVGNRGPPSTTLPEWEAETEALRARGAHGGRTVEFTLADPVLAPYLERAGLRSTPALLSEVRKAREALPTRAFSLDRPALLGAARFRLAEALASPVETLIALAREEERVERVRTREDGAADQWVAADSGALHEYSDVWTGFRDELRLHHDALITRVEAAAHRTVPNLSEIVGARVAARLVAAAGGLAPLVRMSSSRLQLLGSRRRPGGPRGPKYGVLARAVQSADVPAERRGAYARSLAALAVIAARADGSTHARIAEGLMVRRDRRLEQLRRATAR